MWRRRLRQHHGATDGDVTTLPNGAIGVPYQANLFGSGGKPLYEWSLAGGTLPTGLVLNNVGTITGTPTQSGTFHIKVQITDANNTIAVSGDLSMFIQGAVFITTTSLPNGVIGTPYSTTLAATGGVTPYTWSISSGTLPDGLSIDAGSGTISGTPSGSGTCFPTCNFTVKVTDSETIPANGTAPLSITVSYATLLVTTASLPDGQAGVAYSATLTATGGKSPYVWSQTAGTLPPGLNLNPTSGTITGTPTQSGTFSGLVFKVTDAQHNSALSSSLTLTIAAAPTLSITTTSLPDGTQGASYTSHVSATGGIPPYTWSIASGSLPTGLTLSATGGIISGTPIGNSGNFPFTVEVTDSQNTTAQASLGINVNAGNLAMVTSLLPNATVNVPFNAALQATGGTGPYGWVISVGSLPAGLTINANTGQISGTPTATGNVPFTAKVTDSENPPKSVSKPMNIVVGSSAGNTSLNGNYAFSFSGFNSGNAVVMAGSFVADGNGNLTSGEFDLNGTGNNAVDVPLEAGSVYNITPNGIGTLTMISSQGTFNFSVLVSATGNGKLIQDNSDPNTRGSGAIYVQDPTSFVLPKAGPYAFGGSGADAGGGRYAVAGQFIVNSSGAVINGLQDSNDNGTVTAAQHYASGAFQAPDGAGRGTFALTSAGGGTLNYSYYAVSAAQFLFVGVDPLGANMPLSVGSMLPQVGGVFTLTSLKGVTVFEMNGLDPNGGSPLAQTTVGLFTSPGDGTAGFTSDENHGGTMSQPAYYVTYTVANNGRATFGNFGANSPVVYITTPNTNPSGVGFIGFVVGTDSAVTSGMAAAQATPPYTAVGSFLGGTSTPAFAPVTDTVNYLTADSAGNVNVTEKGSGPGGSTSNSYTLSGQIDATGRMVISDNNGEFAIGYAVSSKKFVLLPAGGNADNPNAGTPSLTFYSTGGVQ